MDKEHKKIIKELVKESHTFIRKRDSRDKDFIGGYCFDCGKYVEGQHFQAGHFIPNSKGALTRYHPHNMHGQFSGCNTKYQQEWVKINYTQKMEDKYGRDYVEHLKQMSQKTIKADIIFHKTLLGLYKQGIEQDIVDYLESFFINT